MGSSTEKLTKLHLQAFGLSNYTIKELVKGLDPVTFQGSLEEYNAAAIANSIEIRLANPKIQEKTA